MKIDFDKLDLITPLENKIEKLITHHEYEKIKTKELTAKELKLYILTIISILYKLSKFTIYDVETSKKVDQKLAQELLNIVKVLNIFTDELNKSLKQGNLYKCIMLLVLNSDFIFEALEEYFLIKNTNYITKKMQIEKTLKFQKHHLELNPFIINQYMKYETKKITNEEQIIGDILEYDRIALIILDDIVENIESDEYYKKRIKLVKKQIIKNYNEIELNKVILFIIGDVYQELLENKKDIMYLKIKSIVENEEITTKGLIELFKKSESFSNIMIGKFIDYNIEIKEGRLEELKEKESYQYMKERYKK